MKTNARKTNKATKQERKGAMKRAITLKGNNDSKNY